MDFNLDELNLTGADELHANHEFYLDRAAASGIPPEKAVADLSDNPFDQSKGKNVILDISTTRNITEGLLAINLRDNSSGMTEDHASEAIIHGSRVIRDMNCYGIYGLGMKDSAAALGKRLSFMTKSVDDHTVIGGWDLSVKTNSSMGFSGKVQKASPEASKEFIAMLKKEYKTDHGTEIIIDKLHPKIKKLSNFERDLASVLGRTHRELIKSGRMLIKVNGQTVKPISPILDHDTICRNKTPIPVGTEEIKVNTFWRTKYSPSGAGRGPIEPNVVNQGYSIILEDSNGIGREIGFTQNIGGFHPHNDYNGFFVEVRVPRGLVNLITPTSDKSRFIIDAAIEQKIWEITEPFRRKPTKTRSTSGVIRVPRPAGPPPIYTSPIEVNIAPVSTVLSELADTLKLVNARFEYHLLNSPTSKFNKQISPVSTKIDEILATIISP